jgi:hypothetical protein
MHKPPMKLLSPTEAGRRFTPQVGADRVRALCDRGELKFIRAEGRYGSRLIFEDSIEDYLARRNLAVSQEL